MASAVNSSLKTKYDKKMEEMMNAFRFKLSVKWIMIRRSDPIKNILIGFRISIHNRKLFKDVWMYYPSENIIAKNISMKHGIHFTQLNRIF